VFNCHAHLKAFHDDCITLTDDMKEGMRARRRANQERLARGLEENGDPMPLRHVKQGSYAMHTMVQSEYDASDIDDGVVFSKEDLVGPKGGEYSPLDAKRMVCDALDDGSFKTPPEVHTNCVRVLYNDGFTIDIPVYREVNDASGAYYELASTSWKRADPEGVTAWFNDAVIAKSPDTTNGRQMRRLVKYLKFHAKSRKSWNMPSGFILSKLIDEKYFKDPSLLNRDDMALLQVMEAVSQRLSWSGLVVQHPVVQGETITESDNDADMVELRGRVAEAVKTLAVLRKSDCSELDALKALRDLFNTDYFDDVIAEFSSPQKSEASSGVAAALVMGAVAVALSAARRAPSEPVIKRGGEGRYA